MIHGRCAGSPKSVPISPSSPPMAAPPRAAPPMWISPTRQYGCDDSDGRSKRVRQVAQAQCSCELLDVQELTHRRDKQNGRQHKLARQQKIRYYCHSKLLRTRRYHHTSADDSLSVDGSIYAMICEHASTLADYLDLYRSAICIVAPDREENLSPRSIAAQIGMRLQ